MKNAVALSASKFTCVQGSNLALANLLNASSFPQKASRNCFHLLFLACGNKSLSYEPNTNTAYFVWQTV